MIGTYSPYKSNYVALRDKRDELRGPKRKTRDTNHEWNRVGSSRTVRLQATKPGHKICCRCKPEEAEKPFAAFYRNKNTRDGYQGHCIECHKKAVNAKAKRSKPCTPFN